ncbi:ribosome assembly protein METTL17, mitochondrial [Pogona vitticeps]
MAAARRLWRTWGSVGTTVSSSSRGLASVIPRISQVDNTSDFLGKHSSRRRHHPGVLHLKSVSLPSELVETARFLVDQSSVRNMEKQIKALTNYLWSRKRPVEITELYQKVHKVEQQLKEEIAHAHQEDSVSPPIQIDQQKLQRKVLNAIRKTTYHWKPLKYTDELSFLYMVARMDGVFAAVFRAFHEIHKRVPDFQPRTLLDFGSGTGAASWAAHSIWGQSVKEYMNIDCSASMLALAEKLMKGISEEQTPCFPGVYFRQFLPVSPKVKFDLVVSAYSLNELPGYSERVETLHTLWRKTDGFLVLVENGTKEGHQMLMEARDLILHDEEKVAHDPQEPYVFAPCPHHLPCPRLSRDQPLPCNFIQKYQPLPFKWNPPQKEERFSFLILSRGSGKSTELWPRITQPVLARSSHAHVHLCCPDGSLQHAIITAKKHGSDLYQCARRSKCGDRLPVLNSLSELSPEAEEETEDEKGPADKDQS